MATIDLPIELRKVLKSHRSKLNGITSALEKRLRNAPIPKTIYHYTNDRGLQGILETGTLWFTDIYSMNDPSELRHGINHALEVAKSKAATGSKIDRFFLEPFANAFYGGVERVADHFVCAFSTDGDDLGQWRAYADDGRGFAIGFDAEVLEQAFVKGQVAHSLYGTYQVTYDDKELQNIQEQLISETIPCLSILNAKTIFAHVSRYMQELAVGLASSCVETAICYKHEAYRNEQEYRFLQTFPSGRAIPKLERRYRPYTLVRYRKWNWKKVAQSAIKQIVVGPSQDPLVGTKFAKDCLREFPLPLASVSVNTSTVPYRCVRI